MLPLGRPSFRNLAVLATAAGLVVGTATAAGAAVPAATPTAHTAPGPVSAIRASVNADQATITWHAPSGPVGGYQIDAYLEAGAGAGTYYGTRTTNAGTTTIRWDRLPISALIRFAVRATGPDTAAGETGPAGLAAYSNLVSARNPYCPPATSGDCVVVDPASALGPETHPGSGLLHGTVGAGNAYVRLLGLTHWRIAAANPTQYSQARAFVPAADMIEVLSDAWYNATNGSQPQHRYAADPWANWTAYTNFIRTTVQQAEAAGQDPYWEIQNEPEWYQYSPTVPATRALVEQQYLYAYRAIKSVDPNARVVGPTIDWVYSSSAHFWLIDMKTFIPFAAAHGMKLAAVAWHDNFDSRDAAPVSYTESPQAVRDQSEQVRAIISANPGVGNPLLFVDEQDSASGQFAPGWAAGYLAEDERAGLALASRTCWSYPNGPDRDASCFGPYLDQLLNVDGAPNASFWSMVDYARMTGTRVWSGTSDSNLSSLAVSSQGTTRILLGRHQTCSGWTAGLAYCRMTVPPPAIATSVKVVMPGTQMATVTVQAIPDNLSDMRTPPAATTTLVSVLDGVAAISIPAFDDGEAYFVTVAAAKTSVLIP